MTTAPYVRTEAQRAGDLQNAREFEQWVGQFLPPYRIDETSSNDRLDFWVPGLYLEVKEKRQRLTERWQIVPGVPEEDLFVMDELTVRRSLRHFPEAYFLLRDVPMQRMFLASITEMVCADRVRRDRDRKGKWVLDITQFRTISEEAMPFLSAAIAADLITTPWKQSPCVSGKPIPQV